MASADLFPIFACCQHLNNGAFPFLVKNVFGQKPGSTVLPVIFFRRLFRPSRFLDRLAPLCRCPRETGVSRSFLYLAEGGEPGTFMQAASEKEKGRPEPESGRKTPRSGGRAD
jgi:hypothetical protein